MYSVFYFDDKFIGCISIITLLHFNVNDIGFLIRNCSSNGRQYSPLIAQINTNIGWEITFNIRFPFYINPLVRVVTIFDNVWTGLMMYNDTATGGDEAKNWIAWYRQTTFWKIIACSLSNRDSTAVTIVSQLNSCD